MYCALVCNGSAAAPNAGAAKKASVAVASNRRIDVGVARCKCWLGMADAERENEGDAKESDRAQDRVVREPRVHGGAQLGGYNLSRVYLYMPSGLR